MSTSSKAPARAVALVMVIAALTTAAYFMLVKAPPATAKQWHELARSIARDVDDSINFRPRVTSGGITLLKESASIKELSTLERNFQHTHSWKSTWLGSTKQIELRGSFVAKAGYDLTRPFSIDIAADGQTIRAHMPPARINSVEQLSAEIVKDANGLWNRISAEERQLAMNALLRDARKSMAESGILEEADRAFMAQLEAAIRKSAAPGVEIIREPLP